MMNDNVVSTTLPENVKAFMDKVATEKPGIHAEVQLRIDRYADLTKRMRNQTFNLSISLKDFTALDAEAREGRNTGWGPLVGMPCTYSVGSDDYAGVVTWVSPSGHQIKVLVGHDREPWLATRRKHGGYQKAGSQSWISFLKAETHLDPCF